MDGEGTNVVDDFTLNLDETVQPDGGTVPTFDIYNTGETESGGGTSNGGADDVDPGAADATAETQGDRICAKQRV